MPTLHVKLQHLTEASGLVNKANVSVTITPAVARPVAGKASMVVPDTAMATTDSDGVATFTNLPASVDIGGEGYYCQVAELQPIFFYLPTTPDPVDLHTLIPAQPFVGPTGVVGYAQLDIEGTATDQTYIGYSPSRDELIWRDPALTLAEFEPANTGTVGQLLQRTATGYQWADISQGVISYNDLTDKPFIPTSYLQLTDRPTLFSGSYTDLTNKPTIPAAQVPSDWDASSGVSRILNKPTIPAAQIQSDWNQTTVTALDYIKNKPTIPVQTNADWNATSGAAVILNKPTIPAAQIQADWNQTTTTALDFIKNKPTIPTGFGPSNAGTVGQYLVRSSSGYQWQSLPPYPAAFSPGAGTTGQYLQLKQNGYGWATIPTYTSFAPGSGTAGQVLTKTATGYHWADNVTGLPALGSALQVLRVNSAGTAIEWATVTTDGEANVQSDWGQQDTTADDYIKNKPTLFSGSYTDLTNKPTIPAAQVNVDWNATTGVRAILNKPTIPAAQIQADWNQTTTTALDFIKNKPTIPAAQIQSDWNETDTTALDYIKNKPTIPAAFTIQGVTLTATTVADADYLIFSDESETGDPTTKIKYEDFVDQLAIPAAQIQADWNVTDTSALDYIKNKPDPFAIKAIPNIATTLASVDFIAFADESAVNDVNTRITFGNFRNALNIPEEFDLYADVTTASTSIADTDRFLMADVSVSGEPNRYVTGSTLKDYASAFDFEGYYEIWRSASDVPTDATIGEYVFVRSAIASTGDVIFYNKSNTEITALEANTWFKGVQGGQLSTPSWDSGITLPTGESSPRGVAFKPNGDMVIVGYDTEKVYTHSGGSWDAGFAIPSNETAPSGIAVKANGDILITGQTTDRVYTYSDGSWDSGIARPSNEGRPSGLAVKSNGDILLVGQITDKVYTYSDGSWNSGFDVPNAENNPSGVAVTANGDIVVVGWWSSKIYTYRNGSWDTGFSPPSGETAPQGVTIDPNGNIVIAGNTTDKIYTYRRYAAAFYREIDPLVEWIAADVAYPSGGGSGSLDIHNDVTTSATIADADRIIFSDEDATGDPNRFTTFANFKTALSIPAAQVQSDWNATTGLGVILNKPTIPAAQVPADWNATTGVARILNKPTLPTGFEPSNAGTTGQILTKTATGYQWADNAGSGGGEANVQADWNVTDTTSDAFIKNKPNLLPDAQARIWHAYYKAGNATDADGVAGTYNFLDSNRAILSGTDALADSAIKYLRLHFTPKQSDYSTNATEDVESDISYIEVGASVRIDTENGNNEYVFLVHALPIKGTHSYDIPLTNQLGTIGTIAPDDNLYVSVDPNEEQVLASEVWPRPIVGLSRTGNTLQLRYGDNTASNISLPARTGAFTAADESKLDGIEAGAEENPPRIRKFAVINADTAPAANIADAEIGLYQGSTLVQNANSSIRTVDTIYIPSHAATFGQNPNSLSTDLDAQNLSDFFGDLIEHGGTAVLALDLGGTIAYVQAEGIAEYKNGNTLVGWTLTELTWIDDITFSGTGNVFQIVAGVQDGAKLFKDILGVATKDQLPSDIVYEAMLAGHETDKYASYDNAFVASGYRAGFWVLSTDTNGPPTTANLIGQPDIATRSTNGVVAFGRLRTDADPNNLQWDVVPNAADYSTGDIFYASLDRDKGSHLKITLTSDGTLVGAGDTAYVWATATWQEVGDIANVNEAGNYFRISQEEPSALKIELPYTDILGAPWVLTDGSNVTNELVAAIQGSNEVEELGNFTRVASGLASQGDNRWSLSGTTITFSVADDINNTSSNDYKLNAAVKERAWITIGDWTVEISSFLTRYLSSNRAQYLVNFTTIDGTAPALAAVSNTTIIGEDIHQGQVSDFAFRLKTPNIGGKGGTVGQVWTRGSDDDSASWEDLPLPDPPANASEAKQYNLNVPASSGDATWVEDTGGGGGGGNTINRQTGSFNSTTWTTLGTGYNDNDLLAIVFDNNFTDNHVPVIIRFGDITTGSYGDSIYTYGTNTGYQFHYRKNGTNLQGRRSSSGTGTVNVAIFKLGTVG